MAIAYDAYSLIGTPATGSISGTHTPVSTPEGATIWVVSSFGSNTTADEISTVTYGGVSCTEVAGSSSTLTSSLDASVVHCFHLGSGIPTGAQTVAVTATASVGVNAVYCVTTTASANTEVVDTTVITGTTSNPSGTLSLGGVSCFCAQGWFSGVGSPSNTPLSGWTERQEYDFGNNQGGLTTYNTIGTADVTFGNSCVADEFNYIAIAIRESAGGGVVTTTVAGRVVAFDSNIATKIATGSSSGRIIASGTEISAKSTATIIAGSLGLFGAGIASKIAITAAQAQLIAAGLIDSEKVVAGVITTTIAGFLPTIAETSGCKISAPGILAYLNVTGTGTGQKTSSTLVDAWIGTFSAMAAAPLGGMTLTPADIAAIADAVWAHTDAVSAHSKLDDILVKVTC